MIRVNARLFSILRHRQDGALRDRVTLELPEGSTVTDLLRQLQAPEIGILISINGEQAEETTVLQDGDEVELIPAVAGGGNSV